MKILLTGRNGQLGWELERSLRSLGEIIAFDHQGLDLANPDQISSRVRDVGPDLIVNAAAYTAVDPAEKEPELAMAVNGVAPGVMAEEAKKINALLVHYSTDYVFDGTKRGAYTEDDATNPINAYGESKLAGEGAVRASGCRHLILRTAWVYSHRRSNFLLTIRRLAAERGELRVVDDQHGAPTWARDIAAASARILARPALPEGLYHLAAAGQTTWFGFAQEIVRVWQPATRLLPVASKDYPAAAKRPLNSLLSNKKFLGDFGFCLPDWLECFRQFVLFERRQTEET